MKILVLHENPREIPAATNLARVLATGLVHTLAYADVNPEGTQLYVKQRGEIFPCDTMALDVEELANPSSLIVPARWRKPKPKARKNVRELIIEEDDH